MDKKKFILQAVKFHLRGSTNVWLRVQNGNLVEKKGVNYWTMILPCVVF